MTRNLGHSLRKKSSGLFDCFRQNDNELLDKILKAFRRSEIPNISSQPNQAKNFIINLAKENIKDLSSGNLDVEAIKNIQTSCYILFHNKHGEQGDLKEYLLETLFTPNFLLKDDYSIDENRLAIVGKNGSNFTDFLLSPGNMGISLFQNFLSKKTFSSDLDKDQEIKQKLTESMIFSIPSTREDPGHSDRKILSTQQHRCLKNALRLIPEDNKENFLINILQNFAISQSSNYENFKYIDFVISTIKENITKDKWGDAIEKIFCTPSKIDNAFKNAHYSDNREYMKKIKELIDETFRENPGDKEGFIKKLSDNCDVDLKSRFDALPSVNTQVRKGKFKWGSGLPRS